MHGISTLCKVDFYDTLAKTQSTQKRQAMTHPNIMNKSMVVSFVLGDLSLQKVVFLSFASFALVSCGTAPTGHTRTSPSMSQPTSKAPTLPGAPALARSAQSPGSTGDPARELIDAGRYLDAALLLAGISRTLAAPDRQDYQLRVIALLLQGNYIEQADQIINETNISGLDTIFFIRKTLLAAQVALVKQLPDQAVDNLNKISSAILRVNTEQQKEYHRLSIDVYTTLANHAAVAAARIALEPLLDDPDEVLENQETLLRDLQQLEANNLASLRDSTDDDRLRVWLSLAYVAKVSADIEQAKQGINEWLQTYPKHTVSPSIVNAILAKQPETLGRPTKIALILPMKGRFSKAAMAIRNGFFTAYYAQTNDSLKPTIKLYDEGTDPNNIDEIYQQAKNDGADFVVGPLNKHAVSKLAQSSELQIGVLTLNYGQTIDSTPGNLFQISLSPEQEARNVAEHAWLDGHTNAAAIIPDTSWGSRVYGAFKNRWEELGGVIVEKQAYNIKKNDYAVPIKKLLNIDISESRHKKLKRVLREKILYEPRRRKDVDFIFMAAFSRQGRLIRPQLKFHRASNIPVYATSHVFSGAVKPNMDRDMNGVKFSDMPWTLLPETTGGGFKQQIETMWPNSAKRYMRLYALGIDAYKVIPELNRLRRNRFASFQGETGTLFLDIDNRLQRRLLWAQFYRGIPKVLSEF
jgi:outer membrane PBP1 activator LpoA protein